ncbi:hypothetical protein [Bradyrhizobium sp. USDA 4486]
MSGAAALWAALTLLRPDDSVRMNAIATRIIAGEPFAAPTLESLELDAVDRRHPCHALEMRSVVIVRLRLYENAVEASDAAAADARLKQLRNSIDLALSCVPTESFLWFMRYWTATVAADGSPRLLENLKRSYALGPFEGWIAARRNVFALAVYDVLPPDVQGQVRSEFAALVSSGLLNDAVRSLVGPGWRLRDVLLAELERSSLAMRQYLSNMLHSEGVDVDIPGVERKLSRGWR